MVVPQIQRRVNQRRNGPANALGDLVLGQDLYSLGIDGDDRQFPFFIQQHDLSVGVDALGGVKAKVLPRDFTGAPFRRSASRERRRIEALEAGLRHAMVGGMSGVEDPSKIDLVTYDPARNEYTLVLRELRPWNGSKEQASQLISKVDSYRHFVTTGQLAKNYPDSAGKHVRFQLDCSDIPDPTTAQLLQRIGTVLEEYDIRFAVEILE